MHKILTIIIFYLLLAIPSSAQSFDVLWKQYEKARNNDKPVTCLQILKKIEHKAQDSRQYGHLMAALFTELYQQEEISDDSLQAAIERLATMDSLIYAHDEMAAWIYRIAARRYNKYQSNGIKIDSTLSRYKDFGNEDATESIVKHLLTPSNKKCLDAVTRKDGALRYIPFIDKCTDSKYFNHDIISFIATELQDYEPLISYYEKSGNRKAACIAASLYMETLTENAWNKSTYTTLLAKTDSLITLFSDLVECGELAVTKSKILDSLGENAEKQIAWIDEAITRWPSWRGMNALRNSRNRLTAPSYNLQFINYKRTNSSADQKISIKEIRNIQKMTITATPVVGCPKNLLEMLSWEREEAEKQLQKYLVKGKSISVSKQFAIHKEYETFEDSISLGKLPVGIWAIKVLCDGKQLRSELGLLEVTDLTVLALATGERQTRYVIVNSDTGKPVAGAKLHVCYRDDKEKVFIVDNKGEYIVNSSERATGFYATTDTDSVQSVSSLNIVFQSKDDRKTDNIYGKIFTDRSIYRPGQTMHISLVAYHLIDNKETRVAEGRKIPVKVLDARARALYNDTLTTDAFGVASTQFTLPVSGLNGTYRVTAPTLGCNASFRVEEYKRPTFEVSIDSPKEAYKAGDTITVVGKAKTYSGVPVANGKVVYNVKRRPCWWWRWSPDAYATLLTDTIQTNESGEFSLRMPMLMPKRDENFHFTRFYAIVAEAMVTDLAGETHTSTITLSVGDKPTVLTSDLKDKYLADSAIVVTLNRKNMAGNDIEGRISVSIDGEEVAMANANEKLYLPEGMASGKHHFMAICEGDTIKEDFILFRKSDTRPVEKTDFWFYESGNKFSEDGTQVPWIQFGTSDRDVHVVYSLFSGDRVIESGSFTIDSAVVTKEFPYRKEYGDGICYAFAWVRHDKIQLHPVNFTKTLPDKSLNLAWKTFRNKLLPGQDEEWQMVITDSNGKAADANLMAVLYDKSLDALNPNNWSFYDRRSIYQPTYTWLYTYSYPLWMSATAYQKLLSCIPLSFSRLNSQYIYYESGRDEVMFMTEPPLKSLAPVAKMKSENTTARMAVADKYVRVGATDVEVKAKRTAPTNGTNAYAATEESIGVIAGGSPEEMDIQIRENLSELAFFQPHVHTDATGTATLSFTLPESVTTWRFMAFANDRYMRYGVLTDEVVAQKKLMVQPRLPRFLREGDNTMLPATISNLTDEDMNITAKLTILDAETEKILFTYINKVRAKGNETVGTSFPLNSKGLEGKVLVCRVTVSAKGYSDGEQQYLPVLSAKEMILNSKSYVLNEAGTTSISVADIINANAEDSQLTVEYTDSPEWLMVQALPYIVNTNENNAISLASAYYANTIASHIAKANPDIRKTIEKWSHEESALNSVLSKNEDLRITLQNETPWLADAERETEQKNILYRLFDTNMLDYRNTNITNRLSELQNSDGSWSWWKGMMGSRYITMEVMKTLIRLNDITGNQSISASLINRGWNYLDKQIAKDIAEIKKTRTKGNKPSLTAFQLDYLYCYAISSRKAGSSISGNRDYLINNVAAETKYEDMQSKAMLAIVYAKSGKTAKAKDYVESIRQHTVYREDIGRYFDSYRALYSWCDYRIPTQVAAIEAIRYVEPTDTKTISEMQRWLLQSKRTQMWDSPVNAVNAIYAFLGNKTSMRNGSPAIISLNGKPLTANSEISSLGYEKATATLSKKDIETLAKIDKDALSQKDKDALTKKGKGLIVSKTTDGESWLNVNIATLLSVADTEANSNGISVKREYSTSDFHVGDKITVTITITADRDYDFVTVTDSRPSCLEPAYQLSGYHNGCYQVMRDSQTQYHFNMLSKGTHTITTEYYVTHEGAFTAGTAKAQCAYAPEFNGHSNGTKITTTKR